MASTSGPARRPIRTGLIRLERNLTVLKKKRKTLPFLFFSLTFPSSLFRTCCSLRGLSPARVPPSPPNQEFFLVGASVASLPSGFGKFLNQKFLIPHPWTGGLLPATSRPREEDGIERRRGMEEKIIEARQECQDQYLTSKVRGKACASAQP